MNQKQKEQLDELNKISCYGEEYDCISLINDCLESQMERNENFPEEYGNCAKAKSFFNKLIEVAYDLSTFKTAGKD